MSGDQTLFNTAEGIERLWEVATPLLEHPPPVQPYPKEELGTGLHQLELIVAAPLAALPFELGLAQRSRHGRAERTAEPSRGRDGPRPGNLRTSGETRALVFSAQQQGGRRSGGAPGGHYCHRVGQGQGGKRAIRSTDPAGTVAAGHGVDLAAKTSRERQRPRHETQETSRR